MPGHGWEKTLLPRATQLLDFLEQRAGAQPLPYAPHLAWGPDGAKQASPNHEAEAWSIELLRAVLFGTPQQFDAAKATVLEAYFPRELARGPRGIGLWATEQMAPDSHGGQHLVGTSLTRIAAVLSGDLDLLRETGELMRVTARALQAVAAPDLEVWSAGMRAPGVPRNSAATAWLRALTNADMGPSFRGVRGDVNWRFDLYVGTRGLRYLREGVNPFTQMSLARTTNLDLFANAHIEPPAGVRLKHRMVVYRWPQGHLSVLPRPDVELGHGVCDWCEVQHAQHGQHGRRGLHQVRIGTDWKTPPPLTDVPGDATVITFQGLHG